MSAISSALSGINEGEYQLNSAAVRLSAASVGTSDSAGIDSVDLSSTIVALIQARNQVATSVKVAHTAQDVEKSLFSLLA